MKSVTHSTFGKKNSRLQPLEGMYVVMHIDNNYGHMLIDFEFDSWLIKYLRLNVSKFNQTIKFKV